MLFRSSIIESTAIIIIAGGLSWIMIVYDNCNNFVVEPLEWNPTGVILIDHSSYDGEIDFTTVDFVTGNWKREIDENGYDSNEDEIIFYTIDDGRLVVVEELKLAKRHCFARLFQMMCEKLKDFSKLYKVA